MDFFRHQTVPSVIVTLKLTNIFRNKNKGRSFDVFALTSLRLFVFDVFAVLDQTAAV